MENISFQEYSIFCIDEIYGFIGWVWTFQFIPDSALGLASWASALSFYEGAWVLYGAHHSFGPSE